MEESLMPGHVTQRLRVIGAEAQRVVEHLSGPDSPVDFEKIVPIPEELHVEYTSEGHMGLAAISGNCTRYLNFPWIKDRGIDTSTAFVAYVKREHPKAIELAHKYLSNHEKFGYMGGTTGVWRIGERDGTPTR
jgi:hypothetical protein